MCLCAGGAKDLHHGAKDMHGRLNRNCTSQVYIFGWGMNWHPMYTPLCATLVILVFMTPLSLRVPCNNLSTGWWKFVLEWVFPAVFFVSIFGTLWGTVVPTSPSHWCADRGARLGDFPNCNCSEPVSVWQCYIVAPAQISMRQFMACSWFSCRISRTYVDLTS
jgi:hypothetical protein